MEPAAPHIVVLGAGFGGLTFCRQFSHPTARVTLVDRTNHHLFQPLLYQVATAGLGAQEIAQPVRSILNDRPNVTVLLDEARDVRLASREVELGNTTLRYDYLVLALGGVTSYFGHPEWEPFAPGLKTIEDAMRIRREVLLAFEQAENIMDKAAHDRLLTLVVVGGGATGVELAGALAELARTVLRRDFRRINPAEARILLIEGGSRLIAQFSEELSASAKSQLERLGVEVRLLTRVKNLAKGRVELDSGEVIEAGNILWAAGISGAPLARNLGVELDRGGRVKVQPDLSLPGHPEVFAVGDLASVPWGERTVPGVAPAAIQMASHVARAIEDELDFGEHAVRRPFSYWDKGSMATIGRSAAVAQAGPMEMTGFPAWLAWLGIHLLFLVGFRNKVAVLVQWVYSYFAYKRGARIITGVTSAPALADRPGPG